MTGIEGYPPLPELPAGHDRWEDMGFEWHSAEPCYNSICDPEAKEPYWLGVGFGPCQGLPGIRYIRAIKSPP